jgi:hypothetical protein
MVEKEWKKPSWFEHDINYAQQEEIILLIDIHGPQAYGVHWLLQEFLAAQENYRANLKVIPGLIRKFNTTQAIMQAVLFESHLYLIQNDEFFFSPQLCEKLLKFEDFKQLQAQKAKLGALKKEEKRQEQIKELEAKLSEDDSSQPHNITIHNITEQDKTIKNTLYYKEKEKKEERESFKDFKSRIIQEYRGKAICNCLNLKLDNGLSYMCEAVLRVTHTDLLAIGSKTLDASNAEQLWAWLAGNKHRVGDMQDTAQIRTQELKGKSLKNITGKIVKLESGGEEKEYFFIVDDGEKMKKVGPLSIFDVEIEDTVENIDPKVAALISSTAKTA